ncbi:MAG: hypothetical protein J7639_32910 [Paenibacillaceae bacterium]|nr:hypothetical protein [Paenibacillaceae bacterium]
MIRLQPWVYVVVLGLVFIVYARLLPARDRSASTGMVKEIEETMEHFAAELEEENKQLLHSVAKMKQEHEQQVSKLSGKIEQLEKMSYDLSQEWKNLMLSKLNETPVASAMQAAAVESERPQPKPEAPAEPVQANVPAAPSSPEHETAVSSNLRDRFRGLFDMYDQGKSTEYIAKKLGLNKGEVSLIVQLAKQEEQGRV